MDAVNISEAIKSTASVWLQLSSNSVSSVTIWVIIKMWRYLKISLNILIEQCFPSQNNLLSFILFFPVLTRLAF